MTRRASSRGSVPVRIGAVLLVLGGVGTVATLGGSAREGDRERGSAPGSPFDSTAAACPVPAGRIAAAREEATTARLLLARYPFDPADGIEAVRRQLRAASCLASEGLVREAATARDVAAVWRHEIEADYRAHLVLMERRIDEGREHEALASVRALRRLLADREGPFSERLRHTEALLQGKQPRTTRNGDDS